MPLLAFLLASIHFYQYAKTKKAHHEYLAYMWLVISAFALYITVAYLTEAMPT